MRSWRLPLPIRAVLAVGSGMEAQDDKDMTKAIAFVKEAAQAAPQNAAVQVTLARLEQRGGSP